MIIKGIPSGDLECWCFLVDKKTFEDIRGAAPQKYDVGRFSPKGSPYRYMLYPGDLIDEYDKNLKGKVLILSVDVLEDKPNG